MISWSHIWAVTLRHIYLWRRDINMILALLYWPLLDILIWGFLGTWIQQSGATAFQDYEAAALLGILLWQVVGRGANSFGFAFCEELWSANIVNMFSYPLRLTEWIAGVILYYMIALAIITSFSMLVTLALYNVAWGTMVGVFFMFMPSLVLCCIWLGFTCLQIIIMLGKRGVELGFVIIWFLLPFCGAYYPIDVLPAWAQKFSTLIPMSYIFTGMRDYVMHHKDPTYNMLIGYGLSALYAASALLLFVYCFNRSKKNGLARLID